MMSIFKSFVKHRRLKTELSRQFLAEFLGTFLLVSFGNSSVAQGVLTSNKANTLGEVIWGYALGCVFGVVVSAKISGAHINPAVTFAFAVFGKFPWHKVIPYIVAQYLGGFAAACVTYWIYYDAITAFESVPSVGTASIFATYPGRVTNSSGISISHLTLRGGFSDQIWGTAILLLCICAISDKRNINLPDWLSPIFVGFLILDIGFAYCFNCGFAINPARDLSPRIFTYLTGWGDIPFGYTTIDGYVWWWVPIVAPHLGALLGILIYVVCIEMHHPVEEEIEPKSLAKKSECTKQEMANGCAC